MDRRKRCFDLAVVLAFAPILAVIAAVVALVLLAAQGRPLFYASRRMAAPDRAFTLWKFRTMVATGAASRVAGGAAGGAAGGVPGVSGGHVAARVTPVGRVLRRLRLDELPQVWNVLRGDMGLVGPRPPLPEVVAAHPAVYAAVLQTRPGLTGLATLVFHRREAALLCHCRTAAETDAVYARRCIPAKARLDRLYLRRRSVALDAAILALTLADRLLPGADPRLWRPVLRRNALPRAAAARGIERNLWKRNIFRTIDRLCLTKSQGLRPTILI